MLTAVHIQTKEYSTLQQEPNVITQIHVGPNDTDTGQDRSNVLVGHNDTDQSTQNITGGTQCEGSSTGGVQRDPSNTTQVQYRNHMESCGVLTDMVTVSKMCSESESIPLRIVLGV